MILNPAKFIPILVFLAQRRDANSKVDIATKRSRAQRKVRKEAGVGEFWPYSDSQIAVSVGKLRYPRVKSIITPLPTIPELSETSESSFPDPSSDPEQKIDGAEEVNAMRELAAAAVHMAEQAQEKRMENDLSASLQKHRSTETDLKNYQMYKEALMEFRDLARVRERPESAPAEVKEIPLAKETLESKLKRLEQRVEDLQQELAVVREEKAEMEKLLHEKIAKETPKAGRGVIK